MELDAIDRRILRALQRDGRLQNVDLAQEVGLSPSPCLRRVRRLEEAGVIERYAAMLDAAKIGFGMTIFARVWLTGQDQDTVSAFVTAIRALPQVAECYLMAGDCDFLIRVLVRDLDAYRRFQVEHLARIPGVRRIKTDDLKRIAVATGGTLLPNLGDLEGEESFDPAYLGDATEVAEEPVGDGELIFIRGCKTSRATSIVLRGANEFHLDEMHRSLHDSLCVVKRVLESKSLVVGGGGVEAALNIHLDGFATTLGSKEQLAIKEFAEALMIIPRTLAVNAAQDATDLVAKLCAYHYAGQSNPDKEHYKYYGLDLIKGAVINNKDAGVVEPAMSKVKSLRFATAAAISILRIDDHIKINPPQQQQ